MRWIGIDNGVTGAVAVIDDVANTVEIFDTPTFTVEKPNLRKGGKTKMRKRTMFDERGMASLLRKVVLGCNGDGGEKIRVGIEEAIAAYTGAKKRGPDGEEVEVSQGSASILSVGTGFGIWLGALATMNLSYERIHPATWKAALLRDMPKGKDSGRIKAIQLFPSAHEYLSRIKDHNRADALLIAECRRRRG